MPISHRQPIREPDNQVTIPMQIKNSKSPQTSTILLDEINDDMKVSEIYNMSHSVAPQAEKSDMDDDEGDIGSEHEDVRVREVSHIDIKSPEQTKKHDNPDELMQDEEDTPLCGDSIDDCSKHATAQFEDLAKLKYDDGRTNDSPTVMSFRSKPDSIGNLKSGISNS